MNIPRCKNCNTALTGPYCNQCGQKASTSRITFKSLSHEVIHSLTHIEKGFLYTSIELFIRPGKVIDGYLSGKRVNYHKPFGLYFIWAAIYILIDNLIKSKVKFTPLPGISADAILYKPLKVIYPFYEHYLAFIILPLIVIIPLFTYPIITRRLSYNFAETVIINVYLSAAAYVIGIATQIFGAITDTYEIIQANQINLIIPGLFTVWATYDVLKRKPYWKSVLISLLAVSINYIIFYCYLRFGVPLIIGLFI